MKPQAQIRTAIALVLIVTFTVLSLTPLVQAQSTDAKSFIVGPQVPITGSWYDQTQISRGVFHGTAFPATPPAGYQDAYVNQHYYDLGLTLYLLYERTKDPAHLALARKVNDSWWANSWWIGSGSVRLWPNNVAPPPRHAGVGGLILRALDGRPEMWDWINAYTRFHFNHWVKSRITSPTLFYGLREGAFALHYATWLAVAHPDQAIRDAYRADVEAAAVNYYGRLQLADGSWRWDDPDYTDADGGQLRGVMQPFMVGLLLAALIDVHRLSTNTTVKQNIQNQITKACWHLYSGGPYTTQLVATLNVKVRGFHYFYHGGTTVNPTKYEKGNLPATWNPTDRGDVQNARQAIGPIIAAYGYAYLLTRESFFKTAGDEMWDSAYGATDGVRNYFAGDAKSYNQNTRNASKYLAFVAMVATPTPTATPTPAPSPSPTPVPSPSPKPSPSVTPTPTPSPTPMLPRVVQMILSSDDAKREREINEVEQNQGMKFINCSGRVCYFARRP